LTCDEVGVIVELVSELDLLFFSGNVIRTFSSALTSSSLSSFNTLSVVLPEILFSQSASQMREVSQLTAGYSQVRRSDMMIG